MHRLNRAEYSNAIRDLLAVDVKPGAWLPVDDSGYGFDNIAAVLSTSPALLERYMSAARRISRLAVGDLTLKPVEEIYDSKRDPIKGTRNERISDDLPFDSRAGISIQHYFPVDGEYVFKVRIPGVPIGENDPEIDPVPGAYPGQGRTALGRRDLAARKPEGRERRAGSQRGGGAGRGGGGPQMPYPVDLRLNGARVKRFDVPGGTPDVRQLIIGGPYGASGRGTTASRSKIFICDSEDRERRSRPARKTILTALDAPRVPAPGRRTPTCSRCSRFTRRRGPARRSAVSAKAGDFDTGIQRALEALLVSPDFLFRIEQDPAKLHARQGVSGQRCRAGLAPVVLPLEQHSRRSAARPRRDAAG